MGILTDSINNKWKDSVVELDNEAVELAKTFEVEPIETLCFSRKYPIDVSIDENGVGVISCRGKKNFVLYDKFDLNGEKDINHFLDLFEKNCNLGIEKLFKTKAKLIKQFKAPLLMYVRINGRVTLVDAETDLIILDKIQPSAGDYGCAKQKFALNRLKLKSKDQK